MDNDRTSIVQALLPLMRAALGKVEARDMSDATGFYLDGVLFGILSAGLLHFRVDQQTSAPYDTWEQAIKEGEEEEDTKDMFSHGMPTGGLKFRVVPPFVLDTEDSMAEWGKRAWESAKRAHKASV
ncbi:MAG: TfoX/Sxy family protein [Rhodospirillum sp.]|nr:TfoX/Sxy family protein [Rhodospirillum sp.]MCF8490722.1 TfoX/Sxy family protein [Rhodospirillum sp.]MCF8499379.1 TfoX/Sxy family protein [Rhodospirillum sp.]